MFPNVRLLIVIFLTSVVLSPLAFGVVAAYLVTREPLTRPPGGTFLQTAMHSGFDQRRSDAAPSAPFVAQEAAEEPSITQAVSRQAPPHVLKDSNDDAATRRDMPAPPATPPLAREMSSDESIVTHEPGPTDNAAQTMAAVSATEPISLPRAGGAEAVAPAVTEEPAPAAAAETPVATAATAATADTPTVPIAAAESPTAATITTEVPPAIAAAEKTAVAAAAVGEVPAAPPAPPAPPEAIARSDITATINPSPRAGDSDEDAAKTALPIGGPAPDEVIPTMTALIRGRPPLPVSRPTITKKTSHASKGGIHNAAAAKAAAARKARARAAARKAKSAAAIPQPASPFDTQLGTGP
jgi:hypothetical protein